MGIVAGMGKRIDITLNAATLIVSTIGVVTAEATVPGLASALTGAASGRFLQQKLLGRTPDLAAQVKSELEEALNTPKVHIPAGADVLLAQMFEGLILDETSLRAANRDPDKIIAALLDGLTDPAHRRADLRSPFAAILRPILDRMLHDPAVLDQLRPAFEKTVLDALGDIEQSTVSTHALVLSQGQAISDLATTFSSLSYESFNFEARQAEATKNERLAQSRFCDAMAESGFSYSDMKDLVDYARLNKIKPRELIDAHRLMEKNK